MEHALDIKNYYNISYFTLRLMMKNIKVLWINKQPYLCKEECQKWLEKNMKSKL